MKKDLKPRLEQQFEFIKEIDKEKFIGRQTYLSDANRKENDSEHAWHMAIMTILLSEYANEKIDVLKTVTMLLIHDLVEIDAGDTYAYDEEGAATKRERELQAANRIFGMLPEDQGSYFRELWDEFEAYETADAKYAHLLDNFQPLLLNHASGGLSWVEHEVRKSQIYKRNDRIEETSKAIWEYMKSVVDENVLKGNIQEK